MANAQDYRFVTYGWNDADGGQAGPGRPADLPQQPAGRRSADHQHRRREHQREDRRDRPADRRVRRGFVGQGQRRRPADEQARELRLALPGQGAGVGGQVRGCHAEGCQDAGRGRDGRHVPACHVQPEPESEQHRHAAARLPPGQARRPHPPQRRHLDRRVKEQREAHQGDLRRRGRLRRLAAAGVRPGAGHARRGQEEPQGPRADHGSARADQLGQRREGLLRAVAEPDREGRPVHPEQGQGREDVRRGQVPEPGRSEAQCHAGGRSSVAARAGEPAEAVHRHGADRREHPAVCEQR